MRAPQWAHRFQKLIALKHARRCPIINPILQIASDLNNLICRAKMRRGSCTIYHDPILVRTSIVAISLKIVSGAPALHAGTLNYLPQPRHAQSINSRKTWAKPSKLYQPNSTECRRSEARGCRPWGAECSLILVSVCQSDKSMRNQWKSRAHQCPPG